MQRADEGAGGKDAYVPKHLSLIFIYDIFLISRSLPLVGPGLRSHVRM